jgi:pimeloyl-ACP methyl ester carboxylesterase
LQQLDACYKQWETAKQLQQQVEEEEGSPVQVQGGGEDYDSSGTALGDLHYHVLPGAGHWLATDNPEGLKAMMLPWFRDLHSRGVAPAHR